MNRHLITFLFLGLALGCYVIGMSTPATVFLVLGGLAELVFWVRLLKR